jgi:hypothetical protein
MPDVEWLEGVPICHRLGIGGYPQAGRRKGISQGNERQRNQNTRIPWVCGTRLERCHRVRFSIFRACVHVQSKDTAGVMAWKRKATGGVLGVIGFVLSPLSWWNDAVVNLPLALIFASAVGLFYRPAAEPDSNAFKASVILGYWLTNIMGLVLLHKGAQKVLSEQEKKYSRRALLTDVGVSLAYTALIVLLLKLGVLKPIGQYFAK